MPTADNLFKFMAVRPAQKVSQQTLRRRFIRYASDDSQPKLYAQLLKQETMISRKEAAAKFILSKDYVSGFDYRAPWIAPLQAVLDVLSRHVATQGTSDGAQKQAGDWLGQNGKAIADIRSQLWSSLYAATLSPRTLPQDRRELIDLIRALYFIEHQQEINDWQKVAVLLRARPLVPEALFKPTTVVTPPPGDGPGTTPGPTWQKQKLDLFNRLREQVSALEGAIVEIDTTRQRGLYRQPSKPPQPQREAPTDPKDAQTRVVASSEQRPGQLPKDVTDALSEKTRRAVADSGFSLEQDTAIDILNGLERAQRQYYASMQKIGGLAAVKTAGLLHMSAEPMQGELIDNLTSIYDLPWLFPQDNGFDETIVGAVGSVKPVGVGDLLVVKETPYKYEMGDVADIENVLKSESKTRVHRRLDKTEQTIFTETESTEQSERDLETATRFSLQSEIASTLERDSQIGGSVEVSGGYGPVKVTTSADFATSTAQSDSESSSSSYAQDVTDRSVESLTKRVKESITTKVVNEVEETNTHGFDNTAGTGHICGIYRWVDKYTLGQIYNYGRRMMIEFIVPQPASFYLYARKNGGATTTVTQPEPLDEDFTFTDIKPGNYETWVAAYQVANVDPPPPLYKVIAKAFDQSQNDPVSRSDALSVPEGYVAKECDVHYAYAYNPTAGGEMLTVLVGQRVLFLSAGDLFATLHDEDSIVPVGIKLTANITSYALTIEVKCKRTDAALQTWQIKTYKAIVDAYNKLKSAYDSQLAAASIAQGVVISGNNPDQNRRIEQEELKRGCLTLFTNQHFADFDATRMNVAPYGYPELDVDDAMEEARYVQFFEQAFEWEKMSYVFYPYFWGRKEDWATNSQLSDTDPLFADFLKAGSGRVLVPVRPNYEESIMYYLWTNPGEIWNGGPLPTIDNELYVSIVDEVIAASDADLANATPVGDPWEIKVPTELVKLQDDATLPDWSIPPSSDTPSV